MLNNTQYRNLELIIKGFANHRRLQILNLLEKSPGLSVDGITENLSIGYENASDHIRKMHLAGLVTKHSVGNNVIHRLTLRAKSILVFCKKLK
ncbi:MAG: winged helix-turn-helix domain-containing protein [Patescibacteria group bacterium]